MHRKAKPRLAGRGITFHVPISKAAPSIYTTGAAGANCCPPLLFAAFHGAKRCGAGLWCLR